VEGTFERGAFMTNSYGTARTSAAAARRAGLEPRRAASEAVATPPLTDGNDRPPTGEPEPGPQCYAADMVQPAPLETSDPRPELPARFGAFQVVLWALLATASALPFLRFSIEGPLTVLRWSLGWALTGALCSTGLALVLIRLPEPWLRDMRVVGLIVGGCVATSLVWAALLLALAPLTGAEPGAPSMPKPPPGFLVLRGTMILGLWTAVFLVNLLAGRVQREREHSIRALALAEQAQLQVLRGQVNPHFLFNALNSVIALIGENPRAAKGMVRDVSSLLRRALDADARARSTVEEELDFARLYVKCEEVRFEQRLQVTFEVEEGARSLPVPSLLLQPLVENAIKHGMQGAAERRLEVRVRARLEAGRLILEVANTGSLTPPAGALLTPGHGIGLENVQGRLAHLLPGHHAFSLTEDGGWVTARLALDLEALEDARP
jgi:two-component system, LytTR family, sensor kinase